MSARSPALSALLARYGIEPCGSSDCMFDYPGGIATNGDCRCLAEFSPATRILANQFAAIIRELDQHVTALADASVALGLTPLGEPVPLAHVAKWAGSVRAAAESNKRALLEQPEQVAAWLENKGPCGEFDAISAVAAEIRAGRWKKRG